MNKINLMIFLIASFFLAEFCHAQDALEGKIFSGKATEILDHAEDRVLRVMNETLKFQNGRIESEVLKTYSVPGCNYTSEIDYRRAIAFTIVNFKTDCETIGTDSANVSITGDVIGYSRLIATITIKYPDNTEIKYSVQCESK